MKIVVDRVTCIGAADCIAIAPGTFELDSEGKCFIKNVATWDEAAKILEAAKSCPVACIYVYDDSGKQLWPEQGTPPDGAQTVEKK